jgi:hypothetical protein
MCAFVCLTDRSGSRSLSALYGARQNQVELVVAILLCVCLYDGASRRGRSDDVGGGCGCG